MGCFIWPAAVMASESTLVEEIRTILREQALNKPDESQLNALTSQNLKKGLKAIDPWADVIIKPDLLSDSSTAGIGGELYMDKGRPWVMPYANSPLTRAGIEDRIELYAVNDKLVEGVPLAEIAQLLTGNEGRVLGLKICRSGCDEPENLQIALEPIRKSSVEQVTVAGQTILRVRGFKVWETRFLLERSLATMDGFTPLILDLRDCQGGDLFEAMDVAALFLQGGKELAATVDRESRRRRYYSPYSIKVTKPLTLLVSRNTASAGEVFAGILQAQGRAVLAGKQTRGKCVSQTVRRLSDGSQLHFTNFEIELPDGIHCQDKGLQPDIELTEEEVRNDTLLMARLRGQ
jgi:carboxyl-terminal processing protease